MLPRFRIVSVTLLAVAVAAVWILPAPASAGEISAGLNAKSAGVRYGQALGVLEVCYGSKMTDRGKALEKAYTGRDLDDFKAAAAKVYDAWVKVRGCTNQRDPNTCKIIMDKSCLAAENEIGPKGTELPGLVEFIAHP